VEIRVLGANPAGNLFWQVMWIPSFQVEATMGKFPKSTQALVLRTDFSNERAWEALCVAMTSPVNEFQANVEFLSDAQYKDLPVEEIVDLARHDYDHSFIFVADRAAIADPESPVLVLDLLSEPGRTFRVIPSEAWSVENNLSIANMDFAEFAGSVDKDGVFRGFH